MSSTANARKSEQLVLQRFASTPQKRLADRIKSTVSRISRFFSNDGGLKFNEVIEVLDEMGLKAVDKNDVTISAEEYAALKLFAKKGLE